MATVEKHSRRSSNHQYRQLSFMDVLERVHADEHAETETDRHVLIRRVGRALMLLCPQLPRWRAWIVASDIFDADGTNVERDVSLLVSEPMWRALRAAADHAIGRHATSKGTPLELEAQMVRHALQRLERSVA